jgi:KilA-N domain
MSGKKTIRVKGTEVTILQVKNTDYISLTDMVKGFGDDTMIYSWMRNRNTLEFIGIWEELNNPDFKGNGFVTFKAQAGLNSFNLTPVGSLNAEFIRMKMTQADRLGKLNETAIHQLKSLLTSSAAKKLSKKQ